MSGFVLLDTDVFSYLIKNDTRSVQYKSALEGKRLSLAFVTIGEIYKWAFKRKWSVERIESTKATLQRYVVIPYNDRLARVWGDIAAATELAGKTMGENDCWIAAVASMYGMPLATNNVGHFSLAETLGYIRLIRTE